MQKRYPAPSPPRASESLVSTSRFGYLLPHSFLSELFGTPVFGTAMRAPRPAEAPHALDRHSNTTGTQLANLPPVFRDDRPCNCCEVTAHRTHAPRDHPTAASRHRAPIPPLSPSSGPYNLRTSQGGSEMGRTAWLTVSCLLLLGMRAGAQSTGAAADGKSPKQVHDPEGCARRSHGSP